MQINRVNKNLNKRYPNKNKMDKKCIWCRKFPAHNRNDCPVFMYAADSVQKLDIMQSFAKTSLKLGSLKRMIFWAQLLWIKLIQSKD